MSKHSLENNKFAASILLAGVIAFVCSFIADFFYSPKELKERGFSIAVVEDANEEGAAPVAQVDIGTLLASADAARGQSAAMKKCTACHGFEQGGAAKVGPNLYGTVGGNVAHDGGFAYSDGMKSHGGKWGYEELNQWLKAPASYVKGTKMAFAGIKNDAERADVIMYLKSISPSAPALPAAKPAAAPAEAPKAK